MYIILFLYFVWEKIEGHKIWWYITVVSWFYSFRYFFMHIFAQAMCKRRPPSSIHPHFGSPPDSPWLQRMYTWRFYERLVPIYIIHIQSALGTRVLYAISSHYIYLYVYYIITKIVIYYTNIYYRYSRRIKHF